MPRTRRCSEHKRFLRVTTKLEFCRLGELWIKNNRSSHPWWPEGKEKKWQGRFVIAVHNRRVQFNLVFAGLCYHAILSNLCYTKLPFSRKSRTVQREKKDEMTAILQSLKSYSYYSDETGANMDTGRFRIRDPLWLLPWAFVPSSSSSSRLQNITLNVSFEMFRVFCFISQKIILNVQQSSYGRHPSLLISRCIELSTEPKM